MKHKYFVARIIFVSVFFLIALIGLILRMYHIQIESHEKLFAAAKKTYTDHAIEVGKVAGGVALGVGLAVHFDRVFAAEP